MLRSAITRSPVVTQFAPGLLDPLPPSKQTIIDRIVAQSGLARSTAKRRAETLLAGGNRSSARTTTRRPRDCDRSRAAGMLRRTGAAVTSHRELQSLRRSPTRDDQYGSAHRFRWAQRCRKCRILQALDVLGALVEATSRRCSRRTASGVRRPPHLRSAKQTVFTIHVAVNLGQPVIESTLSLGTRRTPGCRSRERARTRTR